MPKTKLSFAEITILSGNVVHEVDKQYNNAAVPRGNIRVSGKAAYFLPNFLQIFFTEKKSEVTHFNLLYWAANVPVQLFAQN